MRSLAGDRVSRRDFVVVMAAAGGGLLLGCRVDGPPGAASAKSAAAAGPPAFAPNAFVRVGTDDMVTVMLPQAEMGQGIYTTLPMLVAEELEIGLDQVRVEHAPGDDRLYANPGLGFQATGGSTSTRAFYEPMRQAGAAARTMLVAAAAQSWGVEPGSCRAEKGTVIHAATGRRVTYGEVAERAAKLPVPDKVALKNPKDFSLIGTPAKRLDTPSKVNGTALYGIDVRLPGMKIATVAASPVLGGKVAGLDEQKAMAIKGVHQVVKLDDVVAVVADHMWAAKQGLAALAIRWDDGPNGKISTADVVKELEEASQETGSRGPEGRQRALRDGQAGAEDRGRLPGPLPGARRHGAAELHGPRAKGQLRGVGRLAGAGSSPRDRGRGHRPAAGEGRVPQLPAGRWVRPAPGA